MSNENSSILLVRDLLERAGCPIVARELPIAFASVDFNTLGFYVARVELYDDGSCTNGIFRICCAVDVTKDRALTRAAFEAVERFCLAALSHHQSYLTKIAESDIRLFRFEQGKCEGFEYSEEVLAIAAQSRSGVAYAAIGDVFAPYGRRDGNIGAPSTTNGVACHVGIAAAKRAAFSELYERHKIMEAWFTADSRAVRLPISEIRAGHSTAFDIISSMGYELHLLALESEDLPPVVLGFAIHTEGQFPAGVCAAAFKPELQDSVGACLLEILQTLVALAFSHEQFDKWVFNGKPLKTLEHNMFNFSATETIEIVRDWIFRFREDLPHPVGKIDVLDAADRFETAFVDITHPNWISEVRVFRSLSDHLYKLVVGNSSGEQRLLSSPTRVKIAHPFP
ncbi:YcaO-like family protein [Massilia sp. IC2-477]|uniref:YcaO-like family protein n=1 Tax=Massilia sp. IC2-477 TaxID=2887198 RepID=UPI001D12FBF9|nr:YcaO-like family protein [Massilia sp. IC2-477]MCC2958315.1 YcaO-like family protein [Massilia sp. IC2-477]